MLWTVRSAGQTFCRSCRFISSFPGGLPGFMKPQEVKRHPSAHCSVNCTWPLNLGSTPARLGVCQVTPLCPVPFGRKLLILDSYLQGERFVPLPEGCRILAILYRLVDRFYASVLSFVLLGCLSILRSVFCCSSFRRWGLIQLVPASFALASLLGWLEHSFALAWRDAAGASFLFPTLVPE